MKYYLFVISLFFCASSGFAQKTVYIPSFITDVNMDLNNTSSQWCYARSMQSDNVVVFWEGGYGLDPLKATDAYYRVDVKNILNIAEKAYTMYLDSLKFAIKGASVTDKHKLMIFLLYTRTGTAVGSGQDDLVGTLHINPAGASGVTIAHEIGHCFQYITGCDTQGGYRYGFGANASGGNGFWEQMANWMAFRVYPTQIFTGNGYYIEYEPNYFRNILHWYPRYANHYIGDYWAFKHDKTIIARLWRESRKPEDPIETYKRITNITQDQFCDQMYEHGSRLTTWDLPTTKPYAANFIDSKPQVLMNKTADNYWLVDKSVAVENYGYNCVRLNVPTTATQVVVKFKGKAGEPGYRTLNMAKGGWRYGFVALLKDGTRVYSTMGTAKVTNGANPAEQTLTFNCPANCSRLWLVVTGAPQDHWRHAWDDNYDNDESWPYQVQFGNTNILGQPNSVIVVGPTYKLTTTVVGSGSVDLANGDYPQGSTQTLTAKPASGFIFTGWSGDATGTTNPLTITMSGNKTVTATFSAIPSQTITYNVQMLPKTDYTPTSVSLNSAQIAQIFGITAAQVTSNFGTTIKYFGVASNGSLDSVSTANAPGHWFNSTGDITTFGVSPYLYSELNITNLTTNIGQSPNAAKVGDVVSFKQALVYTKSASDIKQIILQFNVSIKSVITGIDETAGLVNAFISPNPSNENFKVELTNPSDVYVISMDGQVVSTLKNVSSATFGETLKAGVYIVKAGNSFYKIVKE